MNETMDAVPTEPDALPWLTTRGLTTGKIAVHFDEAHGEAAI